MEIQKQVSIGHIWRRDRAHEKQEEAFQKARDLATGDLNEDHQLQPDLLVDAETSLAHAKACRLGSERDDVTEIYRDAKEEIQRLDDRYDIRPGEVERQLEFLDDRIDEAKTRAS